MGMRVKITRKGIPLRQIVLKFKKKIELTRRVVDALGRETQNKMRDVIKARSKKGTGKLAAAINLEIFPNGWGVGNIAELDADIKYWKNVNYGHNGYTIRAKRAKFLRFEDKAGNIIYRKEIHNHAVKPMNFVERTSWWFKRRVLTITKALRRI